MPEARPVTRVDDGAVEEIAEVYLRAARGDAHAAIEAVVRDALADLDRADRRLAERVRLVSRGYARAPIAGITR